MSTRTTAHVLQVVGCLRVLNCTLGAHTYRSGTGEHAHAGFRRPAAAVAATLLLGSVRCQQVLPWGRASGSTRARGRVKSGARGDLAVAQYAYGEKGVVDGVAATRYSRGTQAGKAPAIVLP